jgi:hypothetical protein
LELQKETKFTVFNLIINFFKNLLS